MGTDTFRRFSKVFLVRNGESSELVIRDENNNLILDSAPEPDPVSPSFTAPATISPASGPIGTVFSVTLGEATGYPLPITLEGVLMLGEVDVTEDLVDGQYISTAPGTLTWTVTASNGVEPYATSGGSAAVTVLAPVFTTPATITPASGPIGTVFTVDEGVAVGPPAPTLEGELMLVVGEVGTDVTSEMVGGEYTSTSAGTLVWTVTASNGVNPPGVSSDSSLVTTIEPWVTEHATITPESGILGTTFTLTFGSAEGPPAPSPTGELILTVDGVDFDVTSEIVDGEYISTQLGTLTWTVTWTNGTLPNAISEDSSTVVVAPPLDPATALFIAPHVSQITNLIHIPWRGGNETIKHDLTALFRPEWVGGTPAGQLRPGFIASGGLIPPYEARLGNFWTGTRIGGSAITYDANTDPRSDLSLANVMVLTIYDDGDAFAYSSKGDFDNRQVSEPGLLGFVEAAATAGLEGIIIIAEPESLPNEPTATANDVPWRATLAAQERMAHWYAGMARHWLDTNGHSEKFVKVVPKHRLAAKLYDDALLSAIPGGITTHRAFRSNFDEGSTTHVYMWNELGAWALNALFRLTAFGSMPAGDLTTAYVDSAMVTYLTSICEDIVSEYAWAGQGGTDWGEQGFVPYLGETEAAILGSKYISHYSLFGDMPIYADTARTMAATDTGPIGAIGPDWTAPNSGSLPTLDGDVMVSPTNAHKMRYTAPAATAAFYTAAVFEMTTGSNQELDIIEGPGMTLSWNDGNNRITGIVDRRYEDGTVYSVVLAGEYEDGRKVLVEVINDGTTAMTRLTNFLYAGAPGDTIVKIGTEPSPLAADIEDGTIFETGAHSGNAPLRVSYVLSANAVPTDAERIKLFGRFGALVGEKVW